jgi:hypothetical protein
MIISFPPRGGSQLVIRNGHKIPPDISGTLLTAEVGVGTKQKQVSWASRCSGIGGCCDPAQTEVERIVESRR